MTKPELNALVRDVFAFLENDYGFHIAKKRADVSDGILYLNDTTGVKIIFSNREAYLFIYLYKLVDGELVENPSNIYQASLLHGYGLDDIIVLRDSYRLIKPTYMYSKDSRFFNKDNGLRLYLQEFANNLRNCADDVLRGNFEIFPKVETVVKERAERFRQGKL